MASIACCATGTRSKWATQYFEVIHTPGHSSDSICLYNQAEGVLFAGDTPLLIASPDGTYEAGFLAALEKLCARDVRRIYFGHGPPLTEHCNERLRESQNMAAGRRRAAGKQDRIKNHAPVTASVSNATGIHKEISQCHETFNGKQTRLRPWRRDGVDLIDGPDGTTEQGLLHGGDGTRFWS